MVKIGVTSFNAAGQRFGDKHTMENIEIDFIDAMVDTDLVTMDILVFCMQESHMSMLRNPLRTNVYGQPGDDILSMIGKRLDAYGFNLLVYHEAAGYGVELRRGLRMAIFIKHKVHVSKTAKYDFQPCDKYALSWGKGTLAISVIINETSILFTNGHLPFSPNSTDQGLQERISCMRMLDENRRKFDAEFLIGDLNFRTITLENEMGHMDADWFKFKSDRDQLASCPDCFTPGWSECPISYEPTCRLSHNRLQTSVNSTASYDWAKQRAGKTSKRTPSYCDRILYRGKVRCIDKVRRIDAGNMIHSDHAAIQSSFEVDVQART